MFWKILIVLVISMIPLVELRGAIPVAIGMDLGLPEWLVSSIFLLANFLSGEARKNGSPLSNFAIFALKKVKKAAKSFSKKQGITVLILLSFSSWPSLSLALALGPAR